MVCNLFFPIEYHWVDRVLFLTGVGNAVEPVPPPRPAGFEFCTKIGLNFTTTLVFGVFFTACPPPRLIFIEPAVSNGIVVWTSVFLPFFCSTATPF